MDRESTVFLVANPLFFAPPSDLPPQDSFQDILKAIIPSDWKLSFEGIWLHVAPGRQGQGDNGIPQQGFKIHVSATPTNAERILGLVAPECVTLKQAFKVAASQTLLRLMLSKNYSRASSGKFITVYPSSRDMFGLLLDQLERDTNGLDGPYILSDRRYRTSKVLHYRYGAFLPSWQITARGTKLMTIRSPSGDRIPDTRLPYFQLPPWETDPFEVNRELVGDRKGKSTVLAGRYEILASLSFSNSGGVYSAADRKTNRPVIIKEARPHTNVSAGHNGKTVDAVSILKNEYSILDQLKAIPHVVRPVEIFGEWEHTFLVEEQYEGVPLTTFRSRSDFHLFPHTRNTPRLRRFCSSYYTIARQLVELLKAIHQAGVAIGDVSPSNILINTDTLQLCMIDFEGSVSAETPESIRQYLDLWMTPGFTGTPTRRKCWQDRLKDDYAAAGRALLSLILPVTALFDLEPRSEERIFTKLIRSVGLPREVIACARALCDGSLEEAERVLERWPKTISSASSSRITRATHQTRKSVASISSFLAATMMPERKDHLWAGDIQMFSTNSMSIANGACGISLFLKSVNKALPEAAERWMLRQVLTNQDIPPGLFPGLAGIAYAFAQLGHCERGAEVLEEASRSPIIFAEPSWFDGAAGWGWVNLFFYRLLGNAEYMSRAMAVGDQILAMAERKDDLHFWRRRDDGRIHYGLAYGAAGVCLFLLALFECTGNERYREIAESGVRFELANALPQFGGWGWRRWEADNTIRPYWLYGSAGMTSVLTRYYRALGKQEDLEFSRLSAQGAFARFSIQPEQFEGLSGIGEAMIDMYLATNEQGYLNKAYDIADSILRYRVERPEGLAFPGRLLLRLSNDFGTGAAGVGLFFRRLLCPGPRLLHDLDALL